MSGKATLRESLGVAPDPDFELKMLPGWERRSPDEADQAQLGQALKSRFMQMQRPDLYASASRMLTESYESMRSKGVIAYYAATSGDDDALLIPGSIMVTLRKSTPDASVDSYVRNLIANEGGQPLFGDKRVIRVERERVVDIEGSSMTRTGIEYLTPVPGSKRRRALQLVASFARPSTTPGDDPNIVSYKMAFDVCVSTLRWIPSASS